jgi:hypothetical protein
MIHVNATAGDIANGTAGDCHSCAVAMALTRSTRDSDAMVYERDWTMYLRVWSRLIVAPYDVRHFVQVFDGQPRTDDNRIDVKHPDYETMEPFAFDLPDQDDPEWQEECYECEDLCDPSDLDDEGYCKDCQAKAALE